MSFPHDAGDRNPKPVRPSDADLPMDALAALDSDRFELLSAYLDGEVSSEERRQVEFWLANDPELKQLHDRLLKLHRGWQTMPIPTTTSTEQTVQRVMARIERRPRLMLVWSGLGAAAAAVFVGVVSSVLTNGSPMPLGQSLANLKETASPSLFHTATPPETVVMLALDQPPVNIPRLSPTGAQTRSAQPENSTGIK